MTRQPHRRIERSACENAPIRCSVPERHLLAGTGEKHRVLPDEIPAPHDRKPDLALAAQVSPGAMQQDRRIERDAA